MSALVRVRFAPSPTGNLHVGNVRTALFNWLVARHHEGTFILRIEDTDAERSSAEYEQKLLEDLRWLGLEWDEGVEKEGKYGPYRQSDRYEIYREFARSLASEGMVFECFCSEEELERVRESQLARGEMPRYSGTCRNLCPAEVRRRRDAGIAAALRLRVRPGVVGFTDIVYGRIEIETAQISDPVILRSDWSPTYNFSCVVDDVLMKISHVLRGEGHLSNTHRQVLIYEALRAPIPQFAHLPIVLGRDGQKLSKRHGATSVQEFRAQGYLPQALVNYLALLGWSPEEKNKEIILPEELIRHFNLARVSRSPAIFDRAKLDWVNRSHIARLAPDRLAELAEPFLVAAGLAPSSPGPEIRAWLGRAIKAVESHVEHLDQLPEAMSVIFGFDSGAPPLEPGVRDALSQPEALQVVREFKRLVGERQVLTQEAYKEVVAEIKRATGKKGKSLFHPLRAALTGRESGPELERLVPLYEEGSRLNLPRKVMSSKERTEAILALLEIG